MKKAMREKSNRHDEKMDRIEKECQKELARIQAEHEKVAKSLRRITSTVKRIIRRSRRARRGFMDNGSEP
jgi:hypothetical protein